MYHVLDHDNQRHSLKGFPNNRNYHGTVISGSGKQGYSIRFDDLPTDHQDVYIKRRQLLTVLEPTEDEIEYDIHQASMNEQMYTNGTRQTTQMHLSTETFLSLGDDTAWLATTFTMHYGQRNVSNSAGASRRRC